MSCTGSVKTSVGNCACAPPLTIKVTTSCVSGVIVAGALVQVYSDSGYTTLVDSGTTDGSGEWSLSIGSSGTYYIRVTPSAPYAVFTGSRTLTTGGTTVIALGVDADHICWPGCSTPISKTQPFVDFNFGSGTASWSDTDGAFVGVLTVSVPALSPCPAEPALPITYRLRPGTPHLSVEYPVHIVFPPTGGRAACPDASGETTSGELTLDVLTSTYGCDDFCARFVNGGSWPGYLPWRQFAASTQGVKFGAGDSCGAVPCSPAVAFDVCATDTCDGGSPLVGASVVVQDSGLVTVDSGTTDGTGCVEMSVSYSGTYLITVSKAGYTAASSYITVACGDTPDPVTFAVDCVGTACSPCNLPNNNLTVSWLNTAGNSSATLTYSATGPTWATGCNVIGTDSFTVTLACVGGSDQLTVVYYPGSTTCVPGGSTSTAATYATSCVDGGGGTFTWTSPSNGIASDGVYTTSTSNNDQGTDLLKWTGFGFSIPSGATITGILVEIGMFGSGLQDQTVQLLKGGVATGSNLATTATLPATLSNVSYGGSSNLWGATWTPGDINASNFGLVFAANNPAKGAPVVSVDYARIKVYYSGTSITYTSATGGGLTLSATCSPLDLVFTVDGSSTLKTLYGFSSFTVTP